MRTPALAAMLLAAAILAPASARADERPPRYDSNALCVRFATTYDGFSPEVMSRCLIGQDVAFDQIKRTWSSTPEYIQEDCGRRALTDSDGDGDYTILQNCIRAQLLQALPGVH